MPSKYDLTVNLSAYTAHELSVNPQNYMAFLTTAARNYKYSFEDQLLIFAQKPGATACAEIATWNRLGRLVNKGTKGITLLVNRDIPYKLRHVFDLSDTNSLRGHEIKLWQMRSRYEESVFETLKNAFGEIESKEHFVDTLTDIAALVAQDNFGDYLDTLLSARNESFLEYYDDQNIEVKFRTLLQNSIGYMLLTRCGYDADLYYDADDFRGITEFNTGETIAVIGNAGSDITEMVLREIEETVRDESRAEKQNRTVAEKSKSDDNVAINKQAERSMSESEVRLNPEAEQFRTQFVSGGSEEPPFAEQTRHKFKERQDNNDGTDLQTGWRLSSSEPERTGESEDREVWDAAAHISPAAEEADLHGNDVVGQAERASRTDRQGSD